MRESRATSRASAYLHPDFTVTAPSYLPWGSRHVGAAFFREHLLPSVTDVFDFARFSYDNVVAEDGHVVAVFNIGVTGTDAIIKIVELRRKRKSWLTMRFRRLSLNGTK